MGCLHTAPPPATTKIPPGASNAYTNDQAPRLVDGGSFGLQERNE